MKLKILPVHLLIVLNILWFGCANNVENPGINCSLSDLSVSVISQTLPECLISGSITVAGSGGTEPYTFSIDGSTFQSSVTFQGLSAGSLTITINDADGCSASVNFVLEAAPGGIALFIVAQDSECLSNTGSIAITATGGDGNFMYKIDGGSNQSESTFTGVQAGSHSVAVTDGEGCVASSSIFVNSTVSFEADIMPIISTKCAISGCHNGDNGANRNWTIFSNVQDNAQNIKTRTGNGSMPLTGSITQDQVDLIACWVDDGAKDN